MLLDLLPFDILIISKSLSVFFLALRAIHIRLFYRREHHAHSHPLSWGETCFPGRFQVDIFLRGRILNRKFAIFDFGSARADSFEIISENGSQRL
jgi:hypothetical protein